jgi:hypothetical protein
MGLACDMVASSFNDRDAMLRHVALWGDRCPHAPERSRSVADVNRARAVWPSASRKHVDTQGQEQCASQPVQEPREAFKRAPVCGDYPQQSIATQHRQEGDRT